MVFFEIFFGYFLIFCCVWNLIFFMRQKTAAAVTLRQPSHIAVIAYSLSSVSPCPAAYGKYGNSCT